MSWTLTEAVRAMANIQEALEVPGYLVGMYGSVARGELGNDLDLVVWAPDGRTVEPGAVLQAFQSIGCVESGPPYGGGPELYFRMQHGWQEVHVRILRLEVRDSPEYPPPLRRGILIPKPY